MEHCEYLYIRAYLLVYEYTYICMYRYNYICLNVKKILIRVNIFI